MKSEKQCELKMKMLYKLLRENKCSTKDYSILLKRNIRRYRDYTNRDCDKINPITLVCILRGRDCQTGYKTRPRYVLCTGNAFKI